ncbi:hypothetical protein TELCIR_25411 [Teladorsagia circumcincta]|uniref:Uncharacterized protein n=1 Tax=Teladorsagia circumcincta TaxID=45464 RepID=A0A2G9T5N4_TELCI|nr:hypothetical protein TELCIR_25411 [Teladorsagia circumcincta]
MVLPKIERAVEVTQPYTGSLSVFALIYRTYGIIWQYILDNRLETTLALEFYDSNEICVSFPLDHTEEFVIPEVFLPPSSIPSLNSQLRSKANEHLNVCKICSTALRLFAAPKTGNCERDAWILGRAWMRLICAERGGSTHNTHMCVIDFFSTFESPSKRRNTSINFISIYCYFC